MPQHDSIPGYVAGTWDIDPVHSHIGFMARHLMVSKVRGKFSQVTGEITIAEDPLQSTVEVRIPAASIETGVTDRDNHLRSPDFLHVEKHPELVFTNARVKDLDGSEFKLVGDLTIRDVTRQVELDAEFEGVARSPWGSEVIGFSATTEIDRDEFGVTWNQALETGGVMVGKKVKIEISGEAVRKV